MGREVLTKLVTSFAAPADKASWTETIIFKYNKRHRLVMSVGRIPSCPASASSAFSSTPVKISNRPGISRLSGLDCDVFVDNEDAFSQLSPINCDSGDSDEEIQVVSNEHTSPTLSRMSTSSAPPLRCELPRTSSERMLNLTMESVGSPRLSAWELWLVNKTKEERLKLEKKSEEEHILREKKEEEEREQKLRKMIVEEKIQNWLQMKREQEKHQQLEKKSKEKEEIHRQKKKQMETEWKADQKYKKWLQAKNQEKSELEKKEKEKATLKEEQEKMRHQRAEEKFQEWLMKANDKRRASPQTNCDPARPYDKFYPSPSFYNPIPWKPIHTPPQEKPKSASSCTKSQKKTKHQQSSSAAFRIRNCPSGAGHPVPWR